MKRTKTLVTVNTLTALHQPAYANHCNFWFRLGRNYPDHDFGFLTPSRMTIDACRNYACRIAMENEFDYILMLDDDVLIPVDSYSKLLAADKDVVAGNVVIRGYPYNNMIFKFSEDRKKLDYYNEIPPELGNLVEVDAVGCSLTLIKVSLLQKMRPPYFVTGTHNTEDIYFCLKAKDQVPDVKIYCDLSVECDHILTPQAVGPKTKKFWKEFDEKCEPVLAEPKEDHTDRHPKYLAENGLL
jgi:hypothetical protein